MSKRRVITFSLNIQIIPLSEDSVLAVTALGGMTIRGERQQSAFHAARSLFAGLAGSPDVSSHRDSAIALDMALAGTSIGELTDGT